jgi:predicted peptidase
MLKIKMLVVMAVVSSLGIPELSASEEGVPGKQVAASIKVPANMNIMMRRDRSKSEKSEEKAKRRLNWLEDRVDPNSTEELRYWLYLPEDYTSKEKCPLILFLHGAGERGDDLEKVKVHGPPKLVEQRSDCPAIVVSPQCPSERIWSPTQLSLLLDKCMKSLKVDPDRVYVTGLSMGGFGTWALCAKEPERFAAAIPICGGGDASKAKRLVGLPIWVFHGAKDRVVTPENSQKMVDAIRAAGGTRVELTIYPEANHDSWTETYANDEVAKWLLSQKRGK